MRDEIAIALMISFIAVASGCAMSGNDSPDAENIQETQNQVEDESETLQACSRAVLELSKVGEQLVIQQTAGAEAVGQVEVEVETSDARTTSETVNIEEQRGMSAVEIEGEIESATATPIECQGADQATYP